jgi:ribonuclease R
VPPANKKQRITKQRATKRPNRAERRARAASLVEAPVQGPPPKAGANRPGAKPKRGFSQVVVPGAEPGPIAGLVVRHGTFLELEPLFQRSQSLLLAREGLRPRPGDLVLYTYSHGRRGRVLEIIGQKNVLSDVLEVLLREKLTQRGFDSHVLAEAAEVSALEQRVDPQRKDLRQLFTFTVDPEDARDFDDALSFEATDTGVTVFVHIADVSYYVAEGGVIDTEALRRTTSVYVPGAVEPMLPPLLSNGVCSLQPLVDRKAVTVEMVVDKRGNVQKAHFYRSLIRSDRRLDYEELEQIFQGEREADPDLAAALELGRPPAQTIRANRMARGSLRITSSEPGFHWDEAGMVAAAHPVEELESHHFIEDYMILANEQVATYLERERVPTMYRVHEPPDSFLLDHLLDVLSSLDLPTPPFDPLTATPQDVRRTVNEVAESIERVHLQGRGKPALEQQLLRSQSRAVYQTHNVGHFGLASTTYCHFTSPIRRYPDLLVHRGLLGRLGQGPEPTTSTLSEWAEHCSTKEREAAKVELKADDIVLAHLLKQRLDEQGWNTTFSGLVLSLIRSGAFIRFEGLYEGFLPARLMPDDYYELNELESALVGRRTGAAFRLADLVQVRVSGIDEARGRIDVVLADD